MNHYALNVLLPLLAERIADLFLFVGGFIKLEIVTHEFEIAQMAATRQHRPWISRINLTPVNETLREKRQQSKEEEGKQRSVVPRLKKWRLIVRNLGHRFNEKQMRKQFAQHGLIKEVVFGRSKQGINSKSLPI